MASVKRTSLYRLHRQLGARMTEFAGFEMPLSYRGILEEHRSVRSSAGVFDLSHMGEFELSGAGALALLEHALTNSAARLASGQAQYTLMCTADGGTIDDLIVYRLASERFMLCVNAANIATDREWLLALPQAHADFGDISEATALIAVQGPRAESLLATLTDFPLAPLGRFRVTTAKIAGFEATVARTGYTGEDGFEIFLAADTAEPVFEALLAAGAMPCGLGARDTLRMEAGLPLYGHELDRATSPIEAGLATFVKFGRNFVGESILAAHRNGAARKHLAGLQTKDGRSIARQGYRVLRESLEIGVVTSGTFAPSFSRPLAMAYNNVVQGTPAAKPGDSVDVEIRGRRTPATIVPLPFYSRARAAQSNPARG